MTDSASWEPRKSHFTFNSLLRRRQWIIISGAQMAGTQKPIKVSVRMYVPQDSHRRIRYSVVNRSASWASTVTGKSTHYDDGGQEHTHRPEEPGVVLHEREVERTPLPHMLSERKHRPVVPDSAEQFNRVGGHEGLHDSVVVRVAAVKDDLFRRAVPTTDGRRRSNVSA